MLYHLDQCISNSLTQVFESAIGQRVKYTANTGTCLISTANSNLDGGGTIAAVITSSAAYGTFVETITIQAVGNTTRGMVRLFLTNSEPTFTKLIAEIDIPERTVSTIDNAFSIAIKVDFMLEYDHIIAASTEKAESFRIIAEGLDTSYP